MSAKRVIDVVADWVELDEPTLMGRLTATPARGMLPSDKDLTAAG